MTAIATLDTAIGVAEGVLTKASAHCASKAELETALKTVLAAIKTWADSTGH